MLWYFLKFIKRKIYLFYYLLFYRTYKWCINIYVNFFYGPIIPTTDILNDPGNWLVAETDEEHLVISPFFIFTLLNKGFWYFFDMNFWTGVNLKQNTLSYEIKFNSLASKVLKQHQKLYVDRILSLHTIFYIKFLIIKIFLFLLFLEFVCLIFLLLDVNEICFFLFYFCCPAFIAISLYFLKFLVRFFSVGIKLTFKKPCYKNEHLMLFGTLNEIELQSNLPTFFIVKEFFLFKLKKFYYKKKQNLEVIPAGISKLELKTRLLSFDSLKFKNLAAFWNTTAPKIVKMKRLFINLNFSRTLINSRNRIKLMIINFILNIYNYKKFVMNYLTLGFLKFLILMVKSKYNESNQFKIKFFINKCHLILIIVLFLNFLFYNFFYFSFSVLMFYFYYFCFSNFGVVVFLNLTQHNYNLRFLKKKRVKNMFFQTNKKDKNFFNLLILGLFYPSFNNNKAVNFINYNFIDYLELLKYEININYFEAFYNKLILNQEILYVSKEINTCNFEEMKLKKEKIFRMYKFLLINNFLTQNFIGVKNGSLNLVLNELKKLTNEILLLPKNQHNINKYKYLEIFINLIIEYQKQTNLNYDISFFEIFDSLNNKSDEQRYYYFKYGLKLIK